jgi:large subunit ribosomal protein L24
MVRIESAQPRKQRKARYTAPAHVRSDFLNAPLSGELADKYDTKTLRVVKGDTVKVLRGDAKGEEGVIDDVDTNAARVIVHGVSTTKADGTEVPRPIHASNVRITKLNLDDNRRVEKLGGSK